LSPANVPHRELNPNTVTHLSTNRARRQRSRTVEILAACRQLTSSFIQ